ncbi:hypothetical protein LTR53_003858 [Teratosphaeriaceae sp. CCFEE 6253]|nr:hypothetical protein LTR53_003858 [Teratosphaeriaceae sp. CCFEE 6253]
MTRHNQTSLADVEHQLRVAIPRPSSHNGEYARSDRLDEHAIEEIQNILAQHTRTKPWSQHAKAYSLFRMAGAQPMQLLASPFLTAKGAVASEIGDECIPFTPDGLPGMLKDDKRLSKRILRLQLLVLSSPQSMGFNDADAGVHRNVKNGDWQLRAESDQPLGIGAFGRVDQVYSKVSQRKLARKAVRRGSTDSARRTMLTSFLNETETLRKAHHKHLVGLLGSYTDEGHYAMLMSAAKCDLNAYFNGSSMPGRIRRLSSFFGCLARATAYLHAHRIRHNDIKPGNILVSNDDKVMICDFGSAKDWGVRGGKTSEGPIHTGVTHRYLAPEANAKSQRNESCDVWSLGCVFLEILTVVSKRSIADMSRFFREKRMTSRSLQDELIHFHAYSALIGPWIEALGYGMDDDGIGSVIISMLREDPKSRPRAAQAAEMICRISSRGDIPYVGHCCVHSDATESEENPHRSQSRSRKINVVRSETPPPASSHSTGSANTDDGGHSRPESPSQDIIADSERTDLSDDGIEDELADDALSTRHGDPGGANAADEPANESDVPSPLREESTPAPIQVALYDAQEGESIVFEAAIQTESGAQVILGGETSKKSTTSGEAPSRVRLFHTAGRTHWDVTRRLCFSLSASSRATLHTSLWLPLGDIRLVAEEADVVLTFSDCNQDFGHHSYNYEELHDRVYKRMEPNNTLLLQFADRVDAARFADILRGPSPDLLARQQSPDPILLGHDDMVAHPFEFPGREGSSTDRGIVVRGASIDEISTSRLYVLPGEVDIVMPAEIPGPEDLWTIIIKYMQIPTYVSDKRKLHQRDTAIGHFSKVELEAVEVEWAFAEQQARDRLLVFVTGWDLHYTAQATSVRKSGKHAGHRTLGPALTTVWCNASTVQMAVRLSSEAPDHERWITGTVASDQDVKTNGLELDVRVQGYSHGELLRVSDLQGVPLGEKKARRSSEARRLRVKFGSVEGEAAPDRWT